jgi:hypothetical protein
VERFELRTRKEQGALTGRRRPRLPESQDEGLVDLLAVDAVGQRDPELTRAEPLRDLGIFS